MKRLVLTTLFLLSFVGALAQTAKSRADLYTQVDADLASSQPITAAQLRGVVKDVVASVLNSTTDVASQAEAEAGSVSTKYMTPQRVAQAITALEDTGAVMTVSAGVPIDATGDDNDSHIDTATGNLYIKTAGTWGSALFRIQGYDAVLASWAGKTVPTGTVVGTTDTQTLSNKTLASPQISGTVTVQGESGSGATVNNSDTAMGTFGSTGGGGWDHTGIHKLTGEHRDSAGSNGDSGQVLKSNGSGVLTYGADKGSYSLPFMASTTTTINDATTYYLGHAGGIAVLTNQGRYAVEVTKAGTITSASITSYASTAGTAESWEWSIIVNNGTPVSIGSVATATTNRRWKATELSIAVAVGDLVEYVTTTPTWATNPASVNLQGYIVVETSL